MAYEQPGAQERRKDGPARRAGGGVPDGMLVGGVALLAGLAVLTWTSTGLAGVVAHGSWPENVAFVRTGAAVRSYLTAPRDVAGAWPDTPPEQLPSGTVLWLVFLTQVVILFSTALLIAIQVARWRAKRHAGATPGGLRPPGPPGREGRDSRVSLEPEVPTGTAEAPAAPGAPRAGSPRTPAHGAADPYAPDGAGWDDPQAPAAYGPGGTPGAPTAADTGGFAQGVPAAPGRDGRSAAGAGRSAAEAPGTSGRAGAFGPGGPATAGAADPYAPDGAGERHEAPSVPGADRAGPKGTGTHGAGGFVVGGRSGAAGGARDVVAAVVGGPEGLVVVDPDGRVWSKTARQRGKVGPVHVYDPGHVTDAPVRLRWAPQRGCADMAVARRRAAALLGPVRPTEPIFQLDAEAAETLLRCYLHAAALADESTQHVLRWAHQGANSPGQAGKILRTHSRVAPGASMELESALTTHPGRRDAALDLIGKALGGLEQLHIRQSCSPGRVDTLALDNITGEGGTLYVVGDQKETAALRHALVDAVTADQPSLTVIE